MCFMIMTVEHVFDKSIVLKSVQLMCLKKQRLKVEFSVTEAEDGANTKGKVIPTSPSLRDGRTLVSGEESN